MWFRSASKKRPATTPVPRHLVRPCLEALEDRCLLSAGALDPTFGNGAGYVTTSFTGTSSVARQALIQPDGKILATGTATRTGSPGNLAVVRYNLDGSLDTIFGSGGLAQASFGSASVRDMGGAALQADGKIVLAGYSISSGQGVFDLARFGANGALDGTFGNQGEATIAFSVDTAGPEGGVVVQSDGKIVVAGDNNSAFELARYNANGTPDIGFGSGGEVVSSFAQFPSLSARGVLQQSDGKLIVVGDTNDVAPREWLLARYNADGTLDTSFGNQGVVTTALSGEVLGGLAGGGGAVLYPNVGTANDGKIVVAGSDDATGTWQLVRYNANGSLDATFDSGGVAVTNLSGTPSSLALDANGRLVVAGSSAGAKVIARFNTDGIADATFGSGGLAGSSSGNRSVAIYPNAGTANDGKIVVLGSSVNGGNYNLQVGRYLGDSAASPSFSVNGFPSPSTAGVPQSFTVSALDASGNPNPGYTGTVHFSSSDPQAVLPADYTFTAADQGSHTFGATLKTAGPQSITVTDIVTPTYIGGQNIQVNPAAATHFVLSGPSNIAKGTAFSLTVTAVDAYGNVATGYTGTVHFTSSDGNAILPANYTFKAGDSGVHTFTGLKLKTKGKQTITVIDTQLGTILGSLTISVS